ncbi:hypothetical protein Krac_9753 [Ktedonobacter racemifer DSM 44963]|uniref:Uncharacterized protein n=1 Tax=Ktedonobacter racemifer DSM 44963 TaxID=485913 RepID=D6TDH5_KTERA|nr:hypothetical protein Krac_9753 [Ktedonobacter racemifer DSM 44963]
MATSEEQEEPSVFFSGVMCFSSRKPQESEGCCHHAALARAQVWLCAFPPLHDAASLLSYRNSLSVKSVLTPAAARLPAAAAMIS